MIKACDGILLITGTVSFFIERGGPSGGKYQHVICLYSGINPPSQHDWWVESNVARQTKKHRGVYYNRCSLKRQMLQTGAINLSPPPYTLHPIPAPPRAELLFTFHYLNFLEPRCLKRNPFTYCVSFLNSWRAIVKLNFFRLFIFFSLFSSSVYSVSRCRCLRLHGEVWIFYY